MPSQEISDKSDRPKGKGPLRVRSRKKKGNELQIGWLYDLVLWALSILIDLFFREVHPRGAWKIPKTGPVILVAAPHANQVRPLMCGRKTLTDLAVRRLACFDANTQK
jgi:glycerol-3-phosphate O-acyltransferase / dihydroxyacetone phosphate acyltransferase